MGLKRALHNTRSIKFTAFDSAGPDARKRHDRETEHHIIMGHGAGSMPSQTLQILHPLATIICLDPSEEAVLYGPVVKEATHNGAVVLAGNYVAATIVDGRTELYSYSDEFHECETFRQELQQIKSLSSTATAGLSIQKLECPSVAFLGQVLSTLLPRAETQPPPIAYPYLPHGMSLEHLRLSDHSPTTDTGESKEKSEVISGKHVRQVNRRD